MDKEKDMDDVIATTENGKYRVLLEQDTAGESPRTEHDNLTHVITPDQSHYLPVDADGGPLQYGWDKFSLRPDSEELFTRWARIFHGAVVVEHRPHNGPWSIWYLMPEQAKEVTDPVKAVEGEIKEYQAWADGEVYGYVVERAVNWSREDGGESMTTWEQVDSCWYLIGREWAESSARDVLSQYEGE